MPIHTCGAQTAWKACEESLPALPAHLFSLLLSGKSVAVQSLPRKSIIY